MSEDLDVIIFGASGDLAGKKICSLATLLLKIWKKIESRR